jgi:hypothetical protein
MQNSQVYAGLGVAANLRLLIAAPSFAADDPCRYFRRIPNFFQSPQALVPAALRAFFPVPA